MKYFLFSRNIGRKVQIMFLVKSSYVWALMSFLGYVRGPHAVRGGSQIITLRGALGM